MQPVDENLNRNTAQHDTENLFFYFFISQPLQLLTASLLIAESNMVFQGTFLSALMRT